MSTTLTPNMNLPVPGVGTESGPAYATDINNCLTLLDQHDHSPGYGVPVTPAGLNINADLSLNSHNLINSRSLRLQPQGVVLTGAADLGCLYEVGTDLYFNDGIGNNIRITQSGAVAGTPGSISNLVSPASVSYSSAAKKFTFQSAALTPAYLDSAAITLRNQVASSPGLTLQPPTLVSDYSITLPTLPASTLPVSIASDGTMSAAPITLTQLSAAIQSAIAANTAAANLPGMISPFMGSSAPSGWLLCNGAAVSRTTYASLYSVMGNSCGIGDGSTTFNIPDFRGRFLRMVTGSTANDPDASSRTVMATGGNNGNNIGSIQTDMFRSHTHGIPTYNGGGGVLGNNNYSGTTLTNLGNTDSIAAGGSETRPVNAYVNYIIKV
jgi:microcystin-dependent protein